MAADETFCRGLPGQPRIWDATRIRLAQTCWRLHYYKTVRGFRGASNLDIEFGSLYHGAVEAFDKMLLAGVEREEALLSCVDTLLRETWAEKPWGGELVETWQCTDPALVPAKTVKVWRHQETGEISDAPQLPCNGLWECIPKMIPNKKRCKWAAKPSALMPIIDNEAYNVALCAACMRPAVHNVEYQPYNPKKNRISLLRAFLVYADAEDAVELFAFPDGTPAVELQVRLPLPLASPDWEVIEDYWKDGSGPRKVQRPYELLANIDSMVTWEGELAIRERKTTGRSLTKTYWDQFNPDPQIDTYDLVAHLVYSEETGASPRVLVEVMEIGAGYARLRRMPIRLTPGRRGEWFGELMEVIKDAEERAYAATDGNKGFEDAFPRNTSACHSGFGSCAFLEVCRAGSTAEREEILAANFKVERWNPLRAESEVE